MSLIFAVEQGDDVAAWVCFVVGIVVLLAGVVVGLWTSLRKTPKQTGDKTKDAVSKLKDAKAKIGEAKQHINRTATAVKDSGLEGFSAAVPDANAAMEAAGESTDAAQTALEQVEGIVASLPENLRFAGLLVLVGTVLMGVATVQFGGVSLF